MSVRREKVVLDLQDNLSGGMARAAAATALLNRELKALDGRQVLVNRGTQDATKGIDQFRRSTEQTGPAIDRFSGRLAIMAQAALLLGPALVPIGAVAVPALTGLASQLGFAALGMGSLVVATQGVGDALKSVNEAALEPTAANLEKARIAMANLGPEAAAFVDRFQEIRPVLRDLRDSAAAGWFPGLTQSVDYLDLVAPRVASILEAIGRTGGNLVAQGAEALAGGEWSAFLKFVESNAPQELDELGRTVGNLTLGLARLWMSFAPLNSTFSVFLLRASRDFAAWADGLDETEGFREFVEYLQRNGPQVADTLGSIGTAVVSIIKAAAPLGGPVLEAFELVADTLTTIAETPAGGKILTMAAAFVVLNKTLAITAGLLARTGLISAAGAAGMRGALSGGRGTASGAGAGGGTGATGAPLIGRLQSASTSLRSLRGDLRAARELRAIQATAGARSERELARIRQLNEQVARGRATMAGFAKTTGTATAGVAAFAIASGSAGQSLGLQNTAMLGLAGSLLSPVGAAIGASVGLMIDLSKGTDTAREAIERLDALAASGASTAELAMGLKQARTELEDFGNVVNMAPDEYLQNVFGLNGLQGVKDNFSALKNGVEGLFGDSDLDELEKDYVKAAEAADKATRATAAFTKSQEVAARRKQVSGWAREAAGEFLNLAEKIEKPTLSLNRLIKRMENQGLAARDMGRNLQEAIKLGADPTALQNLIDTLGPQAGLALQQLAAGGEGAARRFNKAWGTSQNRLGRLENAIHGVGEAVSRLPDGTVIQIDADTRRARTAIERIRTEAKSVAKDWQINFIVTQTNRINKPKAPMLGESADGSTVPKDGGPYSDRYPYLLAPGEEVISNRYGQADRHRGLLKAINAGRLAEGGTVRGLAGGGTVSALGFAGLPALNTATMSLGALNKALAASQKALSKETDQRQQVISAMDSLRGSVKDRLTSELFGESNVWSSGGSIQDALGVLNADNAAAAELKKQIAMLKSKGLDGAALDALISQGDAQTVANFAGGSVADLRAFELAFERRAANASSAASSAASAAYGAELRQQTRETRAVGARVASLERTVKVESAKNRKSTKRGASSGSRSTRRG